MRHRVAMAVLAVWWIATPAVCGAFLSHRCPMPAPETRAAVSHALASAPADMPCHGGSEAPAPRDHQSGCCDGIQIAVSGSAALDTGPIGADLLAGFQHESPRLARLPVLARYEVEELRSPFRHESPPLLN